MIEPVRVRPQRTVFKAACERHYLNSGECRRRIETVPPPQERKKTLKSLYNNNLHTRLSARMPSQTHPHSAAKPKRSIDSSGFDSMESVSLDASPLCLLNSGITLSPFSWGYPDLVANRT